MKPEIGKTCTYIKEDGEAVAATIKGVLSDEANKVNLNYNEGKFLQKADEVPYDENQTPHTWSYLW